MLLHASRPSKAELISVSSGSDVKEKMRQLRVVLHVRYVLDGQMSIAGHSKWGCACI